MSVTVRNLSDLDDCIHCGHSNQYCDSCWQLAKNPDYCSVCQASGLDMDQNAWVPVKPLPRAGGVAVYLCNRGHRWTCSWGS